MEDGATRLRDRMLRDAIMEVLRSPFDPAGQGADISLVDAGLIGHVVVDEDRVRVELPLPGEWSPFVGPLVAEVQRRVQALPEVTVTEITVTSTQPGVAPIRPLRAANHQIPSSALSEEGAKHEPHQPTSGVGRRGVRMSGMRFPRREVRHRGRRVRVGLVGGRGAVKTHLAHVFTKLGVSTRSELAAEVTRRGL